MTRAKNAGGLVVLATVLILGVALLPSNTSPAALAGLVILAVAAILLEVRLPWGGSVSIGHTVLIAFAGGLLSVHDVVIVGALALVLALPFEIRRSGRWPSLMMTAALALSSAAGLIGRGAGHSLVNALSVGHRTAVVAPVLLAGMAYLVVFLLIEAALSSGRNRPSGWKSALSIYVSLLCAAVLLALASEQNTALGVVAVVPILVLRFSFRQYFEARRTYLQTTQALSMIPEVAGLTPLGHGERTAMYAAALAEWLAFSPEVVDAAATVARLHHIGQIAHRDFPDRPFGPEPDERRQVGEAGERLLSDTGFLNDIAPHVAAVQGGAPAELSDLEAIVRVASTLDDLVGRDADDLADAVIGLLARHEHGRERTMALKLAELCDARPDLVARVCMIGAQPALATLG